MSNLGLLLLSNSSEHRREDSPGDQCPCLVSDALDMVFIFLFLFGFSFGFGLVFFFSF